MCCAESSSPHFYCTINFTKTFVFSVDHAWLEPSQRLIDFFCLVFATCCPSRPPLQTCTITSLASWNLTTFIPLIMRTLGAHCCGFDGYQRKTPSDITSAFVIFSHTPTGMGTLKFPDRRLCHISSGVQQCDTAPGRNVPHTCKLSAHKCFPSERPVSHYECLHPVTFSQCLRELYGE